MVKKATMESKTDARGLVQRTSTPRGDLERLDENGQGGRRGIGGMDVHF